MPNSKPYRLLTLGVLAALGVATAGAFMVSAPPAEPTAPPTLLAAAHANPVDIGTQDTLQAGETLSQLLYRAQLAEDEASALLAELNQHQDPRRLRPGSIISYRRSYASGAVRKVELRLDADRTLAVQRDAGENSWTSSVEEVPVVPDTVVLTGTVTSSLYAALVNGEGSGVPSDERERVADLLADRIFAWQIDFSRDLRKGDQFRILYERMIRPDGTARSGQVLAVQFSINNRDYEAYAYTAPNGDEGYYDRDGESLRRAFLRAPLEFRRISSAFSTGRFHPILKTTRAHNGVDYAAATGTPVRAVGDGVVRRAGWSGGYGNLVELGHIRGYSTRYAHLKGFARGIRPGTRVKQGDIIGYVGSTGLATGPHLHYEFHTNGRAVDPNSIKHISGDPVPSRYRDDYAAAMALHVTTLNQYSPPVLLAERATHDDPVRTD